MLVEHGGLLVFVQESSSLHLARRDQEDQTTNRFSDHVTAFAEEPDEALLRQVPASLAAVPVAHKACLQSSALLVE